MKKNNVRNGGAVLSSPTEVEFINTGHAAQARYVAALANPFASPAVPIPDSFLTAHVSKMGFETSLTNVSTIRLTFFRNDETATGDYRITFQGLTSTGWVDYKEFNSTVGARLVAGGLAFEDVGRVDSVEGTITYRQTDSSYSPLTGSYEVVGVDQRTERNRGFGTLAYELRRRQALDFEGNNYTKLDISFSTPVNIIARYVAIAETDGKQGFTEDDFDTSNFCITSSYPNHHAGVFADTPLPDLDHTLYTPAMTQITKHNVGHHSSSLAAAAHWVASAAGWAWKHKANIANVVRKGPAFYQSMMNFGGSVVSAGGQIMALGARTAPLALGI